MSLTGGVFEFGLARTPLFKFQRTMPRNGGDNDVDKCCTVSESAPTVGRLQEHVIHCSNRGGAVISWQSISQTGCREVAMGELFWHEAPGGL